MKIIDLSQTLSSEMPVFPQDPDILLKEILNSEKDDFTITVLNTGLHSGTHLDAPYHFYPKGRKVLEITLNELMGPVRIIDVEASLRKSSSISNPFAEVESYSGEAIEAATFKNVEKGDIVLLKTGWSSKWGLENYFTHNPYISQQAANFLVKKEIRGLAIDGPSPDKFGETIIHQILLSNDIWIVENLKNLDLIPISNEEQANKNNTKDTNNLMEFFFIPLPLKTEASPIRAFVRIHEK